MGLRRTTSVTLPFCSTSSGAVSPSQEKSGEAAVSSTTAHVDAVPSPTEAKATSSRIAAETAAAASKPLRERGLTSRTRLAKKGVLAAASITGAGDTKVPEAAAASGPQDPQDGMAPALTEPTAVPTAATTKTDSSSPQPVIFAVGEGGGFADHHSPMDGDAKEATAQNMGLGGGEQQQHHQVKAPKRSKKDEFPLKELRITRRRSNLPPPPAATPAVAIERQTNGKANSKRWSLGDNGGTLASEESKGRREEETSESASAPNAAEATERSETNGQSGRVNISIEEEEPSAIATAADEDDQTANNNNYLDKSRVPIMNSAVKDEGPESVEETNKSCPESNSGQPPVIMMDTAVQEEQPQQPEGRDNDKFEDCVPDEPQLQAPPPPPVKERPVEAEEIVPVWSKVNGEPPEEQSAQADNIRAPLNLMIPPELNTHCTAEQLKVMASDAALLEQLVLTTPTKKLTEQLCMVLKDQERALEQEEQQQHQAQQQQQTVRNPSSQTTLKEASEMEQMLGDLAATSELDLLQVFKSFESGPVADDGGAAGTEGNLLSLLVADEEVDMMMEATSTSNVSSPEKRPAGSALPVESQSYAPAAEHETEDQEMDMVARKQMLTEMEQELSQMQRRRDFLLRRLRKQQVHHMGRQLSEEVVGLFELSTRAASVSGKGVTGDSRSYNKIRYLKNNARAVVTSSPLRVMTSAAVTEDVEELTPASIVMRNESMSPMLDLKSRSQTAVGHHPFIKPASPKSIRSFVQKVVATATDPPVAAVPVIKGNLQNSHMKQLHGLPLGSSKSTLDDGHRLQLTNNVGLLKTELRIVEQAVDSEATASSSGGESADELINYSNSVQETLAIANRVAWRWAQERARLASRWNWLTAEIADLEYRIRQHTDLHNQLRKSKGPVLLLRPATAKDAVGSDEATTAASAAPSNVNGYRGLLPGQYSSSRTYEGVTGADGFMADVENEVEGTSCRTRPYQRTAFKRRKLVQTMNLHTISKKAARPSSIKCGCQWPQQPCALCTGRSDPTIPRPLPDMIPRSQRAALLDAGLHPCLSFPDDVSQSIRCEAVLADPQWQHQVLKSSKTALKSSIVAAAAAAGGTYKGLKLSKKDEAVKKAGKKYTQGLISRYKKSKNKSRGTHTKYVQLLKQQKSRKAAIKAGLGVPLSHSSGVHGSVGGGSLDLGEYESGIARSRNASPTHHYYRQDSRIERRSRNSYDIDNIVIPYSVAASTRVEILPYKEIPTPKWKLVDDTDLDEDIQVETNHYQQQQQQAASSDSNSSTITALECDSEEFLDEYIQEKHMRALLEERKKFSTFLKFPYSTRSRANRRIDSRAESSGANTPDPASPAPQTPSIGGDQESIPSPMCPSTPALESVLESETSSQGAQNNSMPIPVQNNRIASHERRRTISLKMLSHQNSTASDAGTSRQRSQTPEPSGPPFERLEYPLTDRKYDDMLRQMPLNHERLDEICKPSELEDAGAAAAASGESVSSVCTSTAKKQRRISKAWNPTVDLTGSVVELMDECGNVVLQPGGVDDSETESIESAFPEDPNDPEWVKSS